MNVSTWRRQLGFTYSVRDVQEVSFFKVQLIWLKNNNKKDNVTSSLTVAQWVSKDSKYSDLKTDFRVTLKKSIDKKILCRILTHICHLFQLI